MLVKDLFPTKSCKLIPDFETTSVPVTSFVDLLMRRDCIHFLGIDRLQNKCSTKSNFFVVHLTMYLCISKIKKGVKEENFISSDSFLYRFFIVLKTSYQINTIVERRY